MSCMIAGHAESMKRQNYVPAKIIIHAYGSESMKTFLNAIKKYFADFGTAVAKGDIWCKLSLACYGCRILGTETGRQRNT